MALTIAQCFHSMYFHGEI